ncbi:hypothetical protein ACGFIU_09135 [Rhodococcus oryzae]|uniref:hypothetical protein n=1 Tax=Rhodococcus oryzae TaxID=2571143 RepID=UPI0037195CF8
MADDDQVVCGYYGQVDRRKPPMKHEIDIGGPWRAMGWRPVDELGDDRCGPRDRILLGTLQELIGDEATVTAAEKLCDEVPDKT